MGKLAAFQERFRQAVHSGQTGDELARAIVSDDLSATARMQVYQNNYLMTLTDLIQGVFPIVTAFVGEAFLRGAAKQFIQDNPPINPRLDTFGETFSEYLAKYPYAEDIRYVADVAALEWAVHELQHVSALADGVVAEPAKNGDYLLNPNVRVIISDFPLLQLWMVGMGQLVPEAVHIEAGGQNIAVCLDGYEVKLHVLSEDELKALEWLAGDADEVGTGTQDHIRTLTDKTIIVS